MFSKTKILYAVCVGSAAAGLAMMLPTTAALAELKNAGAPDVEDELIVYGDGVPLLTNGFAGVPGRNGVRFETDSCGSFEQLGASRSLLEHGNFDEDSDDFDEEDPWEEAQLLMGRWLASHAEIAVIGDGVVKWCDGEDDGDSLEVAPVDSPERGRSSNWLQHASYVA